MPIYVFVMSRKTYIEHSECPTIAPGWVYPIHIALRRSMYRAGSSTLIAGLVASLLLYATSILAAPASFEAAKIMAREQVYQDRNQRGTFYCGCSWEWTGRSGGRVDLQGCGYTVRAQPTRAVRIEWEHIVPASLFGQQRQCWQQGGRANCKNSDPVFNVMEADLHNLTPAIGEVNADRSNYRFGMLPSSAYQHGVCDFKVDFQDRVAQPREAIRGQIARTYFYMHDRYDLRLADQQQRLLMAWDRQHPPNWWEQERNKRVARLMGHGNGFVSGEKTWTQGHRNSGDGLRTGSAARVGKAASALPIIGNTNSKVYHLPSGCPSYNQVGAQNRQVFRSEAEAVKNGYRKAGNCR